MTTHPMVRLTFLVPPAILSHVPVFGKNKGGSVHNGIRGGITKEMKQDFALKATQMLKDWRVKTAGTDFSNACKGNSKWSDLVKRRIGVL